MEEEHFQVQLAKPEREFVKVYKDFLSSELLTVEEKMIYISLKYFVNYGEDSGKVFPSMDTLCRITSLSKPRATRAITSLIKKGIIQKTRRGLTKTNIYTIVDIPSMWKAKTEEELKELAESKIPLSNEELLAEAERRGLIKITKEKEPEVEPTKAQQQALELKPFDLVNTTSKFPDSQEERYSIEQIHTLYDYDLLKQQLKFNEKDIDSVMDILYDTLNSRKSTIRIGGEDKPTMVVISKLMKIGYEEVIYVIEKYNEQTDRVNNPTAYLLTMLYRAKQQYHLDVSNQVHHDMVNWNE